jgi:uncharacterized protein (TIGR00369 family)
MPTLESRAPALHAPHEGRTVDERANHCFGCGPKNPHGLRLRFEVDAETLTATAIATLTEMHEGPPGYVHGGIIATLMDEAMSKLNRPLDVLAMTRNLEVDYLQPAPSGLALTLESRHLRRDGRKIFHEAELRHPDVSVLARAKGFFLVIDPKVLA